jgi:hypothetical protein
MKPIADMSESEILREIDRYPELTETRAELENQLRLRAYVLGWIGERTL